MTNDDTLPGLVDYYASWLDYRRWYLRIPGVQAALRRHGALQAQVASGVADVGTGAPLTDRHLYRIASHSKSLASILILQLVEKGDLRLDDRLSDHLPELASAPVGDRRIGELLSHSGGVIRDGEDGDFWQLFRDFPDRAQLMAMVTADSAAVLPRNDHFKYSNIGYGLLGAVLEAVSGETFPQRVKTHLAAPLDLTDLGGEYEPERRDEYVSGHTGVFGSRRREPLEQGGTGALAAATGAFATATDLTAVFSSLLSDDSPLLDADSRRLQRRPHWQVKGEDEQYGLGLFLDRIAETDLFGHTGGFPGQGTATFAHAESGWVVSAFTNAIDGGASSLAGGFFRLRHMATKADHPLAGPDAARYTGRFASLWGVDDIALIDGRLWQLGPTADDPADGAVPLEVVDGSTLRMAGGRGGNSIGELMRFTFDSAGAVETVRADSGCLLRPFAVPDDAA